MPITPDLESPRPFLNQALAERFLPFQRRSNVAFPQSRVVVPLVALYSTLSPADNSPFTMFKKLRSVLREHRGEKDSEETNLVLAAHSSSPFLSSLPCYSTRQLVKSTPRPR